MMRTCTPIQDKPDIVDVVRDEGVHLVQRGRNFFGLCPFHSEKTPSFSVNPEKQTFCCFGCHEGGDVIGFVMKLRGITFREALGVLGISSPQPPSGGGQGVRRRMRDALECEYRAWSVQYLNAIGDVVCLANRIDLLVTDAAFLALESIREVYVLRDFYTHYLFDCLCDDEEAKFLAWKELTHPVPLSRGDIT